MKTLSFLLLWQQVRWFGVSSCVVQMVRMDRRCSSVRRLLCSASHRYVLPNRHQIRAACRRRCGFRNGANKPSAPSHCSCTGAVSMSTRREAAPNSLFVLQGDQSAVRTHHSAHLGTRLSRLGSTLLGYRI